MAVDPAVASGVGQGLSNFMQSFLQTQNMLTDQAIKKRLANAQTMDAASKIYELGGINPTTQGLVQSYAGGNFDAQKAPGLVPYQRVYPMQQVAPQTGQGMPQVPQTGNASQSQGLIPADSPQESASNYSYDPQQGGNIPGMGQVGPLMSLDNKTRNLVAQNYNEYLKSQTPQGQEELRNLKFAGRSSNSEIASQYNNNPSVKIAQNSQNAMQQMIDNYKNPSPQGDASLILNAFKIKFPNAPDVNSLEELQKAQAAPDKWKNYASQQLNGTFSDETRKNLMRDGISTFRANVESLKGAQEKAQARLAAAGIKDSSVTMEPSVQYTWKQAQALQKDIGAYKPPSERAGGLVAAVAPESIAPTLSKMAGGLYAGAKGLIGNLMPGEASTANAPTIAVPKAGTVQKGYQFIGGDPADPKSWKKVM